MDQRITKLDSAVTANTVKTQSFHANATALHIRPHQRFVFVFTFTKVSTERTQIPNCLEIWYSFIEMTNTKLTRSIFRV